MALLLPKPRTHLTARPTGTSHREPPHLRSLHLRQHGGVLEEADRADMRNRWKQRIRIVESTRNRSFITLNVNGYWRPGDPLEEYG